MVDYFKKAVFLLLTQECYKEYFENYNFFHGECLKATISKGLGLGIIAGSVTVKVPQILKIIQNQSGEGINLLAVIFDLFAMTSNLSYSYVKGFPFSAWGEGLFLTLQTALIGVLVLHYSNRVREAACFVSIFSTLLYALMGGHAPVELLWSMQVVNVPIIVVGKGLQALTNYKNQSTGQLSAATCWLLFGGSAARIFTSIQETGDTTIIVIYVICTILNGVIAGQLLYYGDGSKIKKKKSKGGKKDE